MKFIGALAATLVLALSVSPSHADTNATGGSGSVSELSDRLDVLLLGNRYAWGVDTLDRELLAATFAEDAVADYVAVGDNPLNLNEHLVGFPAIFDWLQANLGHRKGTEGLPMHFVTNQLVELRGEEADLRYYMHNRASSVGGVYYVEAIKTAAGWRIHRLRLEEQTWDATAYEADAHAQQYLDKSSGE